MHHNAVLEETTTDIYIKESDKKIHDKSENWKGALLSSKGNIVPGFFFFFFFIKKNQIRHKKKS